MKHRDTESTEEHKGKEGQKRKGAKTQRGVRRSIEPSCARSGPRLRRPTDMSLLMKVVLRRPRVAAGHGSGLDTGTAWISTFASLRLCVSALTSSSTAIDSGDRSTLSRPCNCGPPATEARLACVRVPTLDANGVSLCAPLCSLCLCGNYSHAGVCDGPI